MARGVGETAASGFGRIEAEEESGGQAATSVSSRAPRTSSPLAWPASLEETGLPRGASLGSLTATAIYDEVRHRLGLHGHRWD
jgi:hypothetical protein